MKITHEFLQDCLDVGHQSAKKTLASKGPWPVSSTPQCDFTLWAHYTIAEAMLRIFPAPQLAGMSLRVSETKKAPGFWSGFQAAKAVKDYTKQQQGVDFCVMGPTGSRTHFLTAESECNAADSESISLTEEGYIWDWSKLLNDKSEHRLLFAVVGAKAKPNASGKGQSKVRRAHLLANMELFLNGTHPQIQYSDGIGGFIIAHQAAERDDSYTFVVDGGKINFQKIPNLLKLL